MVHGALILRLLLTWLHVKKTSPVLESQMVPVNPTLLLLLLGIIV
jgi:hypothetical protein